MSYDVNKIIEESVKDILDSDNNDDMLQENTSNSEEYVDDTDTLLDNESFEESRSYFKEYFKENVEGKK